MRKYLTRIAFFIAAGLVVGLAAGAAWLGPSDAPPLGDRTVLQLGPSTAQVNPSTNNAIWVDGGASGTDLLRLMVGAATRFVVGNDGDVGIGKIPPAFRLDVTTGFVNSDSGYCILGDCITDWADAGGGDFWARDIINSYTYLSNSGDNVGIGTASPGAKLDVNGDTRTIQLLFGGGSVAYGVPTGYSLGMYSNDGAFFVPVNTGNIDSDLRLYITDDATDRFSIWGNTCGGGSCGDINAAQNIATFLGDGRVGIGTVSPSAKLEVAGWYGRTAHNNGGFVGSYNNVGANSTRTNPIYTIGSSYKPADSTLGNMYGIGYTHTNASFIPSSGGWGMYVAADGDARVFLNGSTGGAYFAGSVGIGAPSPVSDLEIRRDNVDSHITFHDPGNQWYSMGYDQSAGVFSLNYGSNVNSAGLTINSSNRVGIGTASPSYKLQVNGDIYATGGWLRVSGDRGLYFQSYGGGWRMTDSTWIRAYNNKRIYTGGIIRSDTDMRAPRFYDQNNTTYYADPASTSNLNAVTARRLNLQTIAGYSRIEARGGFGLLVFADANNGQADGNAAFTVYRNATCLCPPGKTVFQVDQSGNTYAFAYFYLSDRSQKKNIQLLESASSLSKILQLNAVSFDWIDSGKPGLGFIAQDVEKIFPDIVTTGPGPTTDLKSINYGALTAPIVEAIKEQQAQIEELKAQIEKLKLDIEGN